MRQMQSLCVKAPSASSKLEAMFLQLVGNIAAWLMVFHLCVFAVATRKKKGQSAATMYRDMDSVANFLTATTCAGDDPLRQARVIDQLKQMRQFAPAKALLDTGVCERESLVCLSIVPLDSFIAIV